MKHFTRLLFCALAALVFTGCSWRLGDFSIASNANINLNSGNFIVGEELQGRDYVGVFFGPLGVPNIEEAVDNALKKAAYPTCVVGLTNMSLKSFDHAFIFGRVGYAVKGRAVYDRNIKGCEGLQGTTFTGQKGKYK